ncbi:MAG: glycosyltransferase family 87 protein [Terriglobales bacterium]
MTDQTKSSPISGWLNPARIRRQALLLATCLWLGYAATIATPGMRDRFGHLKGADFLHAYVLGTVAIEHRSDALYDARAQQEIGEERVPESAGDYFLPVYGPQYSLIWAPLARLPYGWAAAIWMVLSAAIYAACCFSIWRTCLNLRGYGCTVALLAAAFPGFFGLITFGQNSALALACFVGMYHGLRTRREVLAGVCLGLLAYKPQLALAPACVFVATCFLGRETDSARESGMTAGMMRYGACKVMLGATIAVIAQFLAAWFWYGTRPLITYAHVLMGIGSKSEILEPKLYLMHSLRAFWELLLGRSDAAFVLYVLTAGLAILLLILFWRKLVALEQGFAVMLLVSVLVAPHLTVYDLAVLAPALLWIGDWLQTHAAPRISWLLYLAYVLPFAGPLTRWTHVQLSVICLAALTVSFGLQFWRATPAEVIVESRA